MARSLTTTKDLIRRAVPPPVLNGIQILRRLSPASRLAFARTWLRRLFQRASPLLPDLPPTPRVLFVCHGNIMRSAVAEVIYQEHIRSGKAPAGSHVESAGTAAREGNPADPRGVKVAQDMGLTLDRHRAGRLSDQQVAEADLILVMDFLNEADVVARYPHAAGKVRLLGSFIDNGRPSEITDPYTGSTEDVVASFQMIAKAVDSLSATLSLASLRKSGNSA